jgi:hypothetical protein
MPRRGVPKRADPWLGTAAALLTFACVPDDAVSPGSAAAITSGSAVVNPYNALSIVVSVEVENADSVAVRYGRSGAAVVGVTPAVIPSAGRATVPVFGLLAETRYELQAVAFGGAASAQRDLPSLTTGSLPSDLPAYEAGGSDPSPGYVVFAAGRYGLVIDNDGRVVWYRAFERGPGLNFQPQPNGRYVARPPPADAATPSPWVEIDPLGNDTRTLTCARGLQPRFHDLIVTPDGDYWIMCDETRTMDLSNEGGLAEARVTGTVVQHLSAGGQLLFEWSPFDHFAITDLEAASRLGETVNWTHGNAIDLDGDGNLVVSFRSLSEVTKIDAVSGAVMWRMGGLRNDFLFLGAPTPPFARQHGVRLPGAGQLMLLDNSGDPLATKAERYTYDPDARTARLVASYGPSQAVQAQLGGTTQDLPGGRALVAFGDGNRVQEYDATGSVVWEIEGDPGYVFRAQRIESLYHPGMESPGPAGR